MECYTYIGNLWQNIAILICRIFRLIFKLFQRLIFMRKGGSKAIIAIEPQAVNSSSAISLKILINM